MSQSNSNSLSMYPIACHVFVDALLRCQSVLSSALPPPSTSLISAWKCVPVFQVPSLICYSFLQLLLFHCLSQPRRISMSAANRVPFFEQMLGEVEAWQLPVGAAILSAMYIQHSQTHTQMHRDAMECTGSIERQRRHLPLLLFKAHLLLILPAACKASRTFPDILCVCVFVCII